MLLWFAFTNLLQYGQKGCIVFELRLSGVPQAISLSRLAHSLL